MFYNILEIEGASIFDTPSLRQEIDGKRANGTPLATTSAPQERTFGTHPVGVSTPPRHNCVVPGYDRARHFVASAAERCLAARVMGLWGALRGSAVIGLCGYGGAAGQRNAAKRQH